MMLKTITYYILSLSFIAIITIACSKKDTLNKSTTYANAFFLNNSILGDKMGIKYQDDPVQWTGGKFRVLSGIGKFTFYNKTTGAILLEKELDIQPNRIDTLYVFQPDSTIAPQLIKNTQTNEPAAPAGYMKLKIVNLSKVALTNGANVPYSKLDLIIQSSTISITKYAPIDTIVIGSSLDTASYHLIKKGIRAGAIQSNYKFSFLDHDTKQELLNSGGTLYISTAFNASLSGKNVYTIYLYDYPRATASAAYFFKNNAYYDIASNKLFE